MFAKRYIFHFYTLPNQEIDENEGRFPKRNQSFKTFVHGDTECQKEVAQAYLELESDLISAGYFLG